jgi:hypothetical protein
MMLLRFALCIIRKRRSNIEYYVYEQKDFKEKVRENNIINDSNARADCDQFESLLESVFGLRKQLGKVHFTKLVKCQLALI